MTQTRNSLARTTRVRILATLAVAAFVAAQLGWEAAHGGVVAHHLLNMASLPAVSNWWGLGLLPALTWWLAGFVVRRPGLDRQWPAVLGAFFGALVYGLAFGVAFQSGAEDLPFYFLLGLPILGLVLPLYRGEFLVGFVLGMSWTFGVVIPSVLASVGAGWTALLHLGLYRLFRKRKTIDQ